MIQISFSPDQLNAVMQVLSDGPYRIVAPIIASVQQQVADLQKQQASQDAAPHANGSLPPAAANGAAGAAP